MTKQTTKTENATSGDAAAQIWEAKDGRQDWNTETTTNSVAQYEPDAYCGGKWHWQTRSLKNAFRCASGIVHTEERAKEQCVYHASLSEEQLAEIAAEKHYQALIDIAPKNDRYSSAYNQGWNDAVNSMREFLATNGSR